MNDHENGILLVRNDLFQRNMLANAILSRLLIIDDLKSKHPRICLFYIECRTGHFAGCTLVANIQTFFFLSYQLTLAVENDAHFGLIFAQT